MNHACIIGLLHYCGHDELVTLNDLKSHIVDSREYNEYLKQDPYLHNAKELYRSVWTLKSYGDKRKNTDLTRFDFCPECGKAINWEQIRKEDA